MDVDIRGPRQWLIAWLVVAVLVLVVGGLIVVLTAPSVPLDGDGARQGSSPVAPSVSSVPRLDPRSAR
jgi:hypothetical protein